MPTGTPTASEIARAEAAGWVELARHWTESGPTETAVVLFYDPKTDLERRASEWGYTMDGVDLSALALFAAGLATTEAEAWEEETLDVATRAYEARRFLLSDRIIHWAVPWLIAGGADDDARFLLDLGDVMKVAPKLPGSEGLQIEGEDSFGPITHIDGLLSGWVGNSVPPDNVTRFWNNLAADHPGSAQLWLDLAARADRSS